MTARGQLQCSLAFGTVIVVRGRVTPFAAICDLLPEQEPFFVCLFCHFNRRIATRADTRPSTHHERDVARTRWLATVYGDPDGNAGSRCHTSDQRHTVIRESNCFEVSWSGDIRSDRPCTVIEKPQ